MTIAPAGIEDISTERLEARIRCLARRLFSGEGMDDREAWYLAGVVEHCSRAIADIYRTVDLEQILRGTIRPLAPPARGFAGEAGRLGPPLWPVVGAPDALRGLGDRCLYDVGMAGLLDYQGVSLETLGVSSYHLAADLLGVLAHQHELRELFRRNRMWTLPIEEEIVFLHRCASRFGLHARLLQTLREDRASTAPAADDPGDSPVAPGAEGPTPHVTRPEAPLEWIGSADIRRTPAQDRLLMSYERIRLLSGTDMDAIRRRLREEVIDQVAAVDELCDDLLLYAAGARGDGASPAYLLVGPPGVGRRYLMERLARNLEAQWGVEVPLLIIENSEPSGRSPEAAGPGPVRGTRRRSEPKNLESFLGRSERAPFSILVVDEAEGAPPGLQRRLLGMVKPEATPGRRGRAAGIGGCLVAVTANHRSAGAQTGEWTGQPLPERREPDGGEAGGLPPELQSRLRTLRFAPLSPRAKRALLDREIAQVREWVRVLHGLEIEVTGRARHRLLELGFSEDRGARDLEATVRRHCALEMAGRRGGNESTGRWVRGDLGCDSPGARAGLPVSDAAREETPVRAVARFRRGDRRLIIDALGGKFVYRIPGPR